MIRKSFFNPFSSLLLALAGLAFLVDTLPQAEGQTGVFAPAVLFAMWLVGGLVRLFYENEAKRSFDRHMLKANHAAVWKRVDACWIQVDADQLMPGDVIRLYAGMLCPVGAVLAKGDHILVSEASLTGESGQTVRREGETVRAGTTIIDGKASATVRARIADERPVPSRRARRGTQFGTGAQSICAALVRCMLIVLPFVIMIRGFVLGDWTQALLFALGTAVGLVPEMLPVVTSVCLSGSAHRLKNKQVIVKNVDAMESLGSMDVVCVDKTGTLTEDAAVLEYYTDILGNESKQTLNLAYLESANQGVAANQLNRAIADACAAPELHLAAKDLGGAFTLHASDPFDHVTKASGVKLDAMPEALAHLGLQARSDNHLTIVKGEVESVCTRCMWANFKGKLVPMDADGRRSAYEVAEDMRADGIKVLAVAYSTTSADWDDLVLCGYLGFFDRPKASARDAVRALSDLSVEVRVLTGDSASTARSTCSRLGIPADSVITGGMLDAMEESEALARVGRARVFAELTPAQKAQIVGLIRLSGHTVGYIGDGVNDVPALTAADVGIVVDSAAAESKKAADLVLLERDLGVVAEGVREGRASFANASKYIRIASSSNFGNICSVAASSIFLPFVPATATQLLLLNLCYDATCLALSWDNVDDAEIAHPKVWSGKGLGSFMLHFGFASSAFDIITFAILFLGVCPAVCGGPFTALGAADQVAFVATFQAGWLLECAWTESLVLLILRARSVRDGDRPCRPLVMMVAAMLIASALLALSPTAQLPGLATLPVWYLGIVALLSVLYLVVVSTIKRVYLSRSSSLF